MRDNCRSTFTNWVNMQSSVPVHYYFYCLLWCAFVVASVINKSYYLSSVESTDTQSLADPHPHPQATTLKRFVFFFWEGKGKIENTWKVSPDPEISISYTVCLLFNTQNNQWNNIKSTCSWKRLKDNIVISSGMQT